MIENRVQTLLEKYEIALNSMRPVSGGDINDSYQIHTHSGETWFLKLNRKNAPKEIITTEYESLILLKKYGVKNIPGSFTLLENKTTAGLLIEYYESSPTNNNWDQFFSDLANMHKTSGEQFGGKNNYIGRLPQKNTEHHSWKDFYITCRLEPQIQTAIDQKRLSLSVISKVNSLYHRIKDTCPEEKPSLIHGDLWGGNILITQKKTLLIDPCAHFGHREMDFAMMDLFGGFPPVSSQTSYNDIYPIEPGFDLRKEMYQLYYLLVHLNIFGLGYLSRVEQIIHKFSV